MLCNPIKCKEPAIPKKGYQACFPPLAGIPRCAQVIIVGVTFQSNCRCKSSCEEQVFKSEQMPTYLKNSAQRRLLSIRN